MRIPFDPKPTRNSHSTWLSFPGAFHLSRAVVVDGRAATAVAYKSVVVFNKPGDLVGHDDPSDLILNAVEVFVKDWHKANPAAK